MILGEKVSPKGDRATRRMGSVLVFSTAKEGRENPVFFFAKYAAQRTMVTAWPMTVAAAAPESPMESTQIKR